MVATFGKTDALHLCGRMTGLASYHYWHDINWPRDDEWLQGNPFRNVFKSWTAG